MSRDKEWFELPRFGNSFADAWLFEQDFFDLARIDVETARNDQIRTTSAQCDVTLHRTFAQIARAKPDAIGLCVESLRRRIRPPPITCAYIRATHIKLTDFVISDRLACGI